MDLEVTHGHAIADAAAAASVPHVVYSSAGGAERHTGIPQFRQQTRYRGISRRAGSVHHLRTTGVLHGQLRTVRATDHGGRQAGGAVTAATWNPTSDHHRRRHRCSRCGCGAGPRPRHRRVDRNRWRRADRRADRRGLPAPLRRPRPIRTFCRSKCLVATSTSERCSSGTPTLRRFRPILPPRGIGTANEDPERVTSPNQSGELGSSGDRGNSAVHTRSQQQRAEPGTLLKRC